VTEFKKNYDSLIPVCNLVVTRQ